MDTYSDVAAVFSRPLAKKNGIYRALAEKPRVPLAQRSNFWPLTAALYEPLWRGRSISLLTGGAFSTQKERELMLSWLEPQAGEHILDAGCSAGLYARTLLRAEAGLVVHALDFSLPFLKRAQAYAERDGVNPVFVHADVRALPYGDATFDAIVCGGSLNEFTDVPRTFSEFARVLKPDGRLWLMGVSRAQGSGRVLQRLLALSGLHFFSEAGLEADARTAGLIPQETLTYKPVTFALFRYREF